MEKNSDKFVITKLNFPVKLERKVVSIPGATYVKLQEMYAQTGMPIPMLIDKMADFCGQRLEVRDYSNVNGI